MNSQLKSSACPRCGSTVVVSGNYPICPQCALTEALVVDSRDSAARRLSLGDIPVPKHPAGGMGDYELLEVIAQGGMGVIYKARQRSLNRVVALKLLLGGAHAGADFKRRFQQEAETVAKLKHPNIVPIYEVGEHEGQPFFAMEYVPGTDFSKLTQSHPLPPKTAAHYIHILAETMAYAHQQGVLHRDLKPSNILLGMDDRPRITDFGLAQQMNKDSSLTTSGATLGTPGYLPPEQASAKFGDISVRSDVYSLGAVLFHLVTGRPPFVGGSLADTLQEVVQDEPPSPQTLNPHVPVDLATICLKCLRKPSIQRYENARTLADDIGRFLRNEPIKARKASLGQRFGKCIARQPVVASLCLLILVLAFSAAWMWKTQGAVATRARAEIVRSESAAQIAQAEANRERAKSVLLLEFAKQKEAAAAVNNERESQKPAPPQIAIVPPISVYVKNIVPSTTDHSQSHRSERDDTNQQGAPSNPKPGRPGYKPPQPLPEGYNPAMTSLSFFDMKGFENEIKRQLNAKGGVDEAQMSDAVNSGKFFKADPTLLALAKAHGALDVGDGGSAESDGPNAGYPPTTKPANEAETSSPAKPNPLRQHGRGVVAMVENNQVWCSIGSDDGLKLFDKVRIFFPKVTEDPRTGLRTNYLMVAEIKATIVRKDRCAGVSSAPINVGWIAVTKDVEIR